MAISPPVRVNGAVTYDKVSTSIAHSIVAPRAGNLLITALAVDKTVTSPVAPTGFTIGGTWTGTAGTGLVWAYKLAASGTETSISWSWSNAAGAATVFAEYSIVSSSFVSGVVNGTESNVTTLSATAPAPGSPGGLHVGFAAIDTAGTGVSPVTWPTSGPTWSGMSQVALSMGSVTVDENGGTSIAMASADGVSGSTKATTMSYSGQADQNTLAVGTFTGTERTVAQEASIAAIPNIHAWWRGDSSPTTTVGAGVGQWVDRSSNAANAIQATPSAQPLYVSSPNPGATWSSGKILRSNASASLTAETLFVVARPTANNGYYCMRGASGSGASGGNAFMLINGKQTLSRQGIADTVIGTNAYTNTAMTAFTMDFSSTAARLYQNGTANGSATNPTAPTSGRTTTLGAGYNESDNMIGDIFEVISFSRVLSNAERATVHSYIQDRYGITVSDYTSGADTTAPTVPSNFSAVANSQTQVTLTWTASTDATGVSSYRIQRNGTTLAAAATGTTYVDSTVVAGTSYIYTISAIDAAGNRSAESSTAAVTTPAVVTQAGRLIDKWNGTSLIRQKMERWSGSSLVSRIYEKYDTVVTNPVVPSGSSTPARFWITNGGTPMNRVTWETGINANGKAQVSWVGSFPDVRVRTSKLETGVGAQSQDAFQVYIQDLTTNTTVVDSGIVSGTAESWEASSFTPVAGRRYQGYARVRSSAGVWSAYASTRFVAPSGRVLYFEDYGAIGDGTTRSGTDYRNSIYFGPIRNALKDAQPGDVVKSKAPGTVITEITAASTTLTSTSAVFTSAMVGKKVIVYAAGGSDSSTNSFAHRTTISAVSGDLKSATLANAVITNGTGLTIVVNYAEYWVGHMDIDNGLGSPGNAGGWTLDGTGCVFTSLDVDYSGFRTIIPDITYKNVHYWQKTQTTRGNGLNGNTGPFFIESVNAIGIRLIGCYAERARDAGFLIYDASSDIHIVDCVADHTNADGFHVTGSAHDIQFIRTKNYYIGDDAVANIGYRSDGDTKRPYNIVWESPQIYGQDWGRGVSQGGAYNILVTDLYIERGAGTSFILGSDGDMANTANVQIRRGSIVQPNLRRGQKATYSQGSGTNSTIPDEPWLKLLNSSSATQQRDILIEDLTVADGRYIQIISYGNGAFNDASIILRGITMTGSVNAGGSWMDQSTYPNHIDLRGISVPSGSNAFTTAPSAPNS